MGVSTDGQICFGIAFKEGMIFPWDNEEWEGDEDRWWQYAVCGYEDSFSIFNASGEYLGELKPPDNKIDQYFTTKNKFRKAHPLPITVFRHCSGDYPMYILAIPRTVMTASRGRPEEIEPGKMIVTDDDCELLIKFCKQHGIKVDDGPRWWLSSMYW